MEEAGPGWESQTAQAEQGGEDYRPEAEPSCIQAPLVPNSAVACTLGGETSNENIVNI